MLIIPQKDFFFVRHAETDHNQADLKIDQSADMQLNTNGKSQAYALKPIFEQISFRTICSSPLSRALATAKILASDSEAHFHIINNFTECTMHEWNEMVKFKANSPLSLQVQHFLDNIKNGIIQVLSYPTPTLLVAHGGCYWALCYLLGIESQEWVIGNCILMHFSSDTNGHWSINYILNET